ncbi:reverse transcriptase [Lithospermum erythrorhizon]|uniref:Reverse transcriptase n=1 Tax=Lithospermum erythrorhizon TaxID=34254 RepID=A0AAV3QNM2_LITER
MLLLWDTSRVSCEVLEVGSQFIHVQALCKVTHVSFVANFVYPVYCILERRKLWDHLTIVGASLALPWIILGDFNCYSSSNDKVGGVPLRPYDVNDFLKFRMALTLEDASSTGSFFTWTNGSIWSKLDRALVNDGWTTLGLTCSVSFLPMEPVSDHCPLVVSLVRCFPGGVRPFNFLNMWLEHPSFDEILGSKWGLWVGGTAQFSWASKLKSLKAPLKSLNREEFGGIFEKAKAANGCFKEAVKAHMADPLNEDLKHQCQVLGDKACFLMNAEWSFISQKSRCKHLVEGDRCTKYFHSLIKRDNVRSSISHLVKDDGSLTSSPKEVSTLLLDFYTDILGHFHDDEIRAALFDIGNDNAPGPDGFSSTFFNARWDVVGKDVCTDVKEFFVTGVLLKSWNHTILALLPKTSCFPHLGDFRPIGLTNVLYKLIMKILARLMAPFLPCFVDKAQGAFVKDRNIVDNIFIAQELVRGYSRKRCTPSCMLMVDIRKAFDSVYCSFIEAVLRGFGFPELFLRWILACVRHPTFSVSYNGQLHRFFEGKQGLRQGDPMSPAFFILCIEYLSRLLLMKTRGSDFTFHPKCDGTCITHLAFADDLMLFSYGNEASVNILMSCLEDFEAVSGLSFNPTKSSIYLAGVSGERRARFLARVGFSEGSFPVRYLGIPLAPTSVSVDQFSPLTAIEQYIQNWGHHSLSYAGKVKLIRSVIQGIEGFWFQVFPLHDAVLQKIRSSCTQFFWGGRPARVAWDDLYMLKSEGGLGLMDLKTGNLALLTRSIWLFHTNADSLWVRFVRNYYLGNSSFWNYSPRDRDSFLFKKLCGIRDRLFALFGGFDATIEGLHRCCVVGRLDTGLVYNVMWVSHGSRPWMKLIWRNFIPPKFSFTLWLSCRKRLATRDSLGFMNLEDVSCVFCRDADESCAHLFFACPFSSAIWNHIRNWLGIRRQMSTLESAIKWIKKEHGGKSLHSRAILLAFCIVVHEIWRARNGLVFVHEGTSLDAIVARVKLATYRILIRLFPLLEITF